MKKCGEVWRHYTTALLRFDLGSAGEVTVDLAAPMPLEARCALESAGLQCGFGIVTPCNPGGRVLSNQRNEELLTGFEAYLHMAGINHRRVVGMSRDYAHQEPGFALRVELSQALMIAGKWDQLAIYWWNDGVFYLVPTDDCELTMEKLPAIFPDASNP